MQQSKQLRLNFEETLEVPLSSSSEMSIAADYSQRLTENQQLLEMILERASMWAALKRVRQNKGAPGVDDMTVDQAGKYLKRHWLKIRAAILDGTYQPLPVRRREIPKPDGGVRLLGIPAGIAVSGSGPDVVSTMRSSMRRASLNKVTETSLILIWRNFSTA
jgi:hypothetical protein